VDVQRNRTRRTRQQRFAPKAKSKPDRGSSYPLFLRAVCVGRPILISFAAMGLSEPKASCRCRYNIAHMISVDIKIPSCTCVLTPNDRFGEIRWLTRQDNNIKRFKPSVSAAYTDLTQQTRYLYNQRRNCSPSWYNNQAINGPSYASLVPMPRSE